jgi:prepilin-type N-terminal cleavage/methylation domain-containing protein
MTLAPLPAEHVMNPSNTVARDERGFTLLEILMVVALGGTMMAMAMLVSPGFLRRARAEAGITQAIETMRTAREIAISQRRNVELRFVGNNEIQTVRQDLPTGTTTLRSITFENRVQFLLVSGVPDTPDLFTPNPPGLTNPVAFGTSATRMFTSEGTLVDQNGDPMNGTLFLAIPGDSSSARALTILGTTGLMRMWRWDGSRWVE